MTDRAYRTKLILVVFAALAIAVLICCQFYPREVRNWESSLNTADGKLVRAVFTFSNTKQFGHAHLFLVGGGSPKFKVSITPPANAEPVVWVGNIRPVVINILHGRLYLVALGRRNGESNTRFVAAVHENGAWKEIPVTEIPPVTAIHNCGFPDDDTAILREITRRDYLASVGFRRSITARLWFCIEHNKTYADVYNATVSEEFVTAYYGKYFGSHYEVRPKNKQ